MAVCHGDISGYGKSLRYADKLLACQDLPVTCLHSKNGQKKHYFS
jgi:hypothetical protein